jgi:hypothetical protein
MNIQSRIPILLMFVSTFVTPITAQNSKTVLSVTAKALGGETVKTVRYGGSGSSYIVSSGVVPAAGWPHSVMRSYVCDLDLDRMTSKLQIVREEGMPPIARALNAMTEATSPWSSQYQFWITPHGFLKGASVYDASVGSKTVYETTYKTISFKVPGNYHVVGYINEQNLLEKVETWIGEVAVEAQFHGYADFGGVQFPTLITERQGGELSLILIVKEVEVAR